MMLHTTWNVVSPKLAEFISNSAADAISPTTTGLNPLKMPYTTTLSLWGFIWWIFYATKPHDGITTTNVHISEPNMPNRGEDNASEYCPGATYPI